MLRDFFAATETSLPSDWPHVRLSLPEVKQNVVLLGGAFHLCIATALHLALKRLAYRGLLGDCAVKLPQNKERSTTQWDCPQAPAALVAPLPIKNDVFSEEEHASGKCRRPVQ